MHCINNLQQFRRMFSDVFIYILYIYVEIFDVLEEKIPMKKKVFLRIKCTGEIFQRRRI